MVRGCAAALRGSPHGARQRCLGGGRTTANRLRIGLNCATVLVGNVGSSTRLNYTALGDGVNVASRVEGINKLFGTTICISDSVYDHAKANVLARPLKRVQVKGRKTSS